MIARPCPHPRCPAFAVEGGRHCAAHAPAERAAVAAAAARLEARRGSAHARGYDATWATYARALRARFPLSLGYLTRTAYWTPQHAATFAAARDAAAAAGRALEFFRALTPAPESPSLGLGHWALGLGPSSASLPPIYDFHPSPAPEPAGAVDHIIPAAGPRDPLFWAPWNHQVLSHRQHSEKTARFDGGFRGTTAAALEPSSSTP